MAFPWHSGFYPPTLGWLQCVLEEGQVAVVFLPLQEVLGTLVFLFSQLEVAHALQSHTSMEKIEALREVGAGGGQMHADQAVDSGRHLSGIILTKLGAQRWWAMNRLCPKDGVGWFQR